MGVVGEPGVGKSRLLFEFARSHRTRGWLVLECGSVPYGKATPYLPVIDLLKTYFNLDERDDERHVREKIAAKLLRLDSAPEPSAPALLSLFDIPIDDPEWHASDPRRRRERTLDAVKRVLLAESRIQPLLLVFEDLHWIDTETRAFLDTLLESLPPRAHPHRCQLSTGVSKRLGRQDLLHASSYRPLPRTAPKKSCMRSSVPIQASIRFVDSW